MISRKSRKQRYNLHNAPLHKKRKWISSHLAENLLLKYDRRSIPVVKGDTVKIMRGSFRGHEDKVAKVNIRDQTVEIEGVTITTAKGTKLAKPIHASTLLITKLNLTDKWRRRKLEKSLSETAKKEIEKEAEEQLKVQEAAKAEEAAKAAEKQKEEIPEPLKEEETTQAPVESIEPKIEEENVKETSETEVSKKKPAKKKSPAPKTIKKKKEEGEP
ncbi:MAG: 50S ribosomal protein L24 [Candidatus Thermoplasmatota archaeon]